MAVEHPIKFALDGVSAGTALATLLSWLPPIAASLTIVWTLIRIYESPTVQHLIAKLKARFRR